MPWIAAGGAVLSSVAGGLLGGSKEGERNAKDAAASAKRAQEDARRQARADLSPYMQEGESASRYLSKFLGTGDPEGYAPRPTRQQFEDAISNEHFNRFGKDYNRNSNMAVINLRIDREYQDAMKKWEAGKKQYAASNPQTGDPEFGSLLKKFSQEDLDNDVVYQSGLKFGLDQGTQAIDARARASGSMGSGRVLKDLMRFGNDYGTTKANESYVRNASDKDRTYNYLSGSANRGLGAVGTSVGVGQNTANNIGNVGINSANSVAALSQNRQDRQTNSIDNLLTNLLYTYKNNNSRQYEPNKTWGGVGEKGYA